MGCTHGQIKSVNCELFCVFCGAHLPADWLTGKNTPAPADTAKTPEKGEKQVTKTTRRKAGGK